MKRLRVLISAYACDPGKGSEPGIGWNVAVHIARHHEVWVVTRADNRDAIEAALSRNPIPGLHFVYYELPAWLRFWKRGSRGVQLHYYLWQVGALGIAHRLHHEVGFDLAHHVTYAKYWAPSFLAFLPVPYVWGPVGGGESAPWAFWTTLGAKGAVYETFRSLARYLGELDPLVRRTVRRATLALATTQDTAARLYRLGTRNMRIMGHVALSEEDVKRLSATSLPKEARPVRFLSVGRLLALKGFHLALQAFARADLEDAEYWIIGDGPERGRLQAIARHLGIADRVRFLGALSRDRVLQTLAQCHVLVHPSLHDSGSWVCLEAAAAGRPVICLDLGGPGFLVTEEMGVKVAALTPEQTIRDMAEAMRRLARDSDLRVRMGELGRRLMAAEYTWEIQVRRLTELYAWAHGTTACDDCKS